ncbi:DUF2231 domain-containing protein [Dokdonella sp.]|uniref:DUF2231 domain-containing protein n=2 Tax=Dokdonella sp. TaxID=2291710 RepID=UPI002C460E36|nr:DUF2231 domain-containing protein [Dokdonella sp.]HPN80261.1 DUF2231 domain-containing protein [Dokdonella sp.]
MSHPLHPALVHFPIATWSLATLADLAGLAWGEPAWRWSGVLMAVGTLTALVAMAAGFIDFLKLAADHPAATDAQRHLRWETVAWCCYAASLLLRLDGSTLAAPDLIGIGLGAAGFASLCVAGWLGGKLVYAHGVGVDR